MTVKPQSLTDEIRGILAAAAEPLHSTAIYERCTLAETTGSVSNALFYLNQAGHVFRVPLDSGVNRWAYTLNRNRVACERLPVAPVVMAPRAFVGPASLPPVAPPTPPPIPLVRGQYQHAIVALLANGATMTRRALWVAVQGQMTARQFGNAMYRMGQLGEIVPHGGQRGSGYRLCSPQTDYVPAPPSQPPIADGMASGMDERAAIAEATGDLATTARFEALPLVLADIVRVLASASAPLNLMQISAATKRSRGELIFDLQRLCAGNEVQRQVAADGRYEYAPTAATAPDVDALRFAALSQQIADVTQSVNAQMLRLAALESVSAPQRVGRSPDGRRASAQAQKWNQSRIRNSP